MLNLNFVPFPQLQTERLLLREINMSDAQKMFELRSSEEVMKYIDRPRAQSIQEGIEFVERNLKMIEDQEGISWVIALRDNPDQLIGHLGFWRMEKEHFRAEVGYILDPAYKGKGIMTEALNAVIRYGFDVMNMHSLVGTINPENLASAAVLEKNKFVREAYFRENYFFNGVFLDSAIYCRITDAPK